jgi:4-hydroxy-3-methylbut-2-enyl diphosphate reductase
VARLRGAGVEVVDEEMVQAGDRVVIRTHGVNAGLLRRLRARGPVVDATCPYVRSCQTLASRMAAAGYAVLLVGDRDHPEVRSVLSHAADAAPVPALAAASSGEVPWPALEGIRKLAVLAQTTSTPEALAEVAGACAGRFFEVRVFDTICRATRERQREARELARVADVVVVVGDGDSANTARLTRLCAAIQPRTYQVEGAADVRGSWLQGARRVAVLGGAATAEATVREVAARLADHGRAQ